MDQTVPPFRPPFGPAPAGIQPAGGQPVTPAFPVDNTGQNALPRDVSLDEVKDGDHLPWNGGYSMAAFLKSWETEYKRYKKNTGVQEKTIEDNLKLIAKLTWLHTIEDIKSREYVSKSDKDSVYEVCAFLRDELVQSGDSFNGYNSSQYRKAISLRYKPNKGSHSEQKTRELINFPEIVTQTMDLLDDDVKVFFILTAVCGARTTQLYRVFDNPLTILKHDGFFRVVAEKAGQGSKLATEYFFPNDYLPMVENFKLYKIASRQSPETFYNNAVSEVSRKVNPNIPCNLSSLRKFAKAVLSKSKIPESSAEYTQGRKPQGIGAKDYDNVQVAAVDDYPQTLPFWKKYIQLPDWMKDGDEVKKRVDAAIQKRQTLPGGKKAWDEKNIVRRLKAGATNAQLKKEFDIGSQTIIKIVRKYGIVRTNDRGAGKKRQKSQKASVKGV